MNIKLKRPARYRISRGGPDKDWPYLVERRAFFIWWNIFRTRSEQDAINNIRERMAKYYVPPKQILREYTEQDYLADKLKHG